MDKRNRFEYLLVGALILVLGVANVWHVLDSYFRRPPDRIFVGITHYYEDYFYYLSQVTQGATGSWLTKNLYTGEAIPGSLLWWPNLILGKVSGLLGLAPWTAYDLAVFIASLISLTLIYRAARRLYPDNRWLRLGAFLIATFTTCYYLVQSRPDGSLFINPYQYFYNYTESLNRLGGVFHLILQNILSLAFILTAASLLEIISHRKENNRTFGLKILGLTGVSITLLSVNPLYLAVDAASVVISGAVIFLTRPSFRRLWRLVFAGGFIGILLLAPTIYIMRIFDHPFYRYFRWWENSILPTNMYIFFHSVGLPVILFPLGIIPFLRHFRPLRVLGVVWALLPVAVYFTDIPKILGVPYFRLHQPPSYIILGAVAAEGLYLLGVAVSALTRKPVTGRVVFSVLLSVYLAFQLPMIGQEVSNRLGNYTLSSWLNYLPRPVYEGLLVLKSYPREQKVLAFNNLEVITPAVTGHTVYQGHHSLTVGYAEKIAAATQFFSGVMSQDEARQFLTRNNIGYVLWRKSDGPVGNIIHAYGFLGKKFENSGLVIFAVP